MMEHSPVVSAGMSRAWSVFPELEPVSERETETRTGKSSTRFARASRRVQEPAGHIKASTLSFATMDTYGDLLLNFFRARKAMFIDQLHWNLPQADGIEFDQYDTPLARWIVIHEFGEILGGIRLTPTTAQCGLYTYMLKDAQKGLLENIPTDVLFLPAPVNKLIWEASRLFIAGDIPAKRRHRIQSILMGQMMQSARDLGATHVIGIVPAVWSRWLRRLNLDAVAVGPRFQIDGTSSQAALFSVIKNLI